MRLKSHKIIKPSAIAAVVVAVSEKGVSTFSRLELISHPIVS